MALVGEETIPEAGFLSEREQVQHTVQSISLILLIGQNILIEL